MMGVVGGELGVKIWEEKKRWRRRSGAVRYLSNTQNRQIIPSNLTPLLLLQLRNLGASQLAAATCSCRLVLLVFNY